MIVKFEEKTPESVCSDKLCLVGANIYPFVCSLYEENESDKKRIVKIFG